MVAYTPRLERIVAAYLPKGEHIIVHIQIWTTKDNITQYKYPLAMARRAVRKGLYGGVGGGGGGGGITTKSGEKGN